MTKGERDMEIGRIAREYAENAQLIGALRARLQRQGKALREAGRLVCRYLKAPGEMTPAEVVPSRQTGDLDMARIRHDVQELHDALEDRRGIEQNLEAVGLGDLVKEV